MPAHENASQVVYLPFVIDETFLKDTMETLDRLHEESAVRGHSTLSFLLSVARSEAEDDLRSKAKALHLKSRIEDNDDGAAEMAHKLACRTVVGDS